MIRVVLPYHLQQLAGCAKVVELGVPGRLSISAILDALESDYPVLRGTIRDTHTGKRRDFIRFFASGKDISLDDPNDELPRSIAEGRDEFRIVGAMAGG